MKRQKNLAGYTIVEVMIFLAVSGGLLVAVMTMISGQQARTEFNTGLREFDSSLQDLVNDVQDGFYPNIGGIKCDVTPDMYTQENAKPVISTGNNAQGTNQSCVLLGELFGGDTSDGMNYSNYNVISVVGKRLDYDPVTQKAGEPATLAEAEPTAFYKFPERQGSLQTKTVPNGLQISKIRRVTFATPGGAPTIDEGFQSFGIISTTNLQIKNSVASNLSNGSTRLVAVARSISADPVQNLNDSVTNLKNSDSVINSGGIIICMSQGSGGRPAAVLVGLTLDKTTNPASPQPKATGQRLGTEIFVDDDAATLGCAS